MSLSAGYIREHTHYFEVRVYYENTDAGGVVYHADYLKFAEQARTELLRGHGISQAELKHLYTCVLVVTQLNIKYEKAARLDDIIQVRTKLERTSKATLDLHQTLWVGEDRIADMAVTVAAVDSEKWNLTRLPEDMIKKIKEGLHG
jgi:acyl-CoA thioester hydrolase